MGQNKNAALLTSIIHFAFNRKQQQILNIIYKFLISIQNRPIYSQIASLITDSIDQLNPVQKFFQNFYMIDQQNEIAEKILYELCNQQRLLIGNNINYYSLAKYLNIRISFLKANESYGYYENKIDLYQAQNKKFFYLIPEPIFYELPLDYCIQCKNYSDCIKLSCQHKLCTFCIQTKTYYKCCQQQYNEIYLQNKLEQQTIFKEYNKRSKALLDYYDNSKSLVQNTLQNSNSNKAELIQNDSLKSCDLCNKKIKTQLFIQKDCQHQYCYDCMLQNSHYTYCHVTKCKTRIDQKEYQNYLLQFKKENKDKEPINQSEQINQQNSNRPKELQSIINEQCSKCNTTLSYKLFQITKCNHRICNTCLQVVGIFNTFYKFCLVQNCKQTFTLKEYKNYIQYLQDASKSEIYQENVNIPKYKDFKCQNCLKLQNEDMQYILNCGNVICQKCVIENQLIMKCCSIAAQDKEYQNFRNNLKINCEDCQNTFLVKNIFILNCHHKFCLQCCQKIYSQQIHRCLVNSCKQLILNQIDNLIIFIIDQDTQQNKENQIKQENNVKLSLNEEHQIDKLNKEIKEEEKIIEKTNLSNRNQCQENKNEEEKSISTQNSVITIKEIQKVDYENQENEKKNQESKQKNQIIMSNRSKIQNVLLNDKQRKLEKQKQNFLEADSVFEGQNQDEQCIKQQIEEINLTQEKENDLCKGNCSKCYQEFSTYNKRQEINCKCHQIGVCCIFINFKNCPQCEQEPQKAILIKQKLILPTNPVEIEYIFDSTIIKPSQQNYHPQSYQQTYQRQPSNFENIEKYKQNQGSAYKRNATIDQLNKRVSESQKFTDDRSQLRNDLRNRNELTLQRSPHHYNQQVYNTQYYEKHNYARYTQGNLYGQPKREYLSGYPIKFQ
ncbi:unnamed protein product [Paramecium sonneborni]|uniref:RING-type domain-containing protein n=1 Tax=Paramecium sonneborni TaxID=65129 RepID=A0A8S1QC82_9CILI|nr:unnamed protein product [Paramecium sonneborni]